MSAVDDAKLRAELWEHGGGRAVRRSPFSYVVRWVSNEVTVPTAQLAGLLSAEPWDLPPKLAIRADLGWSEDTWSGVYRAFLLERASTGDRWYFVDLRGGRERAPAQLPGAWLCAGGTEDLLPCLRGARRARLDVVPAHPSRGAPLCPEDRLTLSACAGSHRWSLFTVPDRDRQHSDAVMFATPAASIVGDVLEGLLGLPTNNGWPAFVHVVPSVFAGEPDPSWWITDRRT